jgi:hypothetical protein
MLTVEDYWGYPDRYSIANQMWHEHNIPGDFQETVIPKLALFVLSDGIPCAFMACSMDNSIGKATVEGAMTKGGMTAAEARAALLFGQQAIESAISPEYSFLQTFTSPAIARTLEQEGWLRMGDVIHLTKVLK